MGAWVAIARVGCRYAEAPLEEYEDERRREIIAGGRQSGSESCEEAPEATDGKRLGFPQEVSDLYVRV